MKKDEISELKIRRKRGPEPAWKIIGCPDIRIEKIRMMLKKTRSRKIKKKSTMLLRKGTKIKKKKKDASA